MQVVEERKWLERTFKPQRIRSLCSAAAGRSEPTINDHLASDAAGAVGGSQTEADATWATIQSKDYMPAA
jgi:hypothetical protein